MRGRVGRCCSWHAWVVLEASAGDPSTHLRVGSPACKNLPPCSIVKDATDVNTFMRKVGQALQGLTEVRVGESHRWSAPGCVPEVLAPLQGRQGMMTTG